MTTALSRLRAPHRGYAQLIRSRFETYSRYSVVSLGKTLRDYPLLDVLSKQLLILVTLKKTSKNNFTEHLVILGSKYRDDCFTVILNITFSCKSEE